MLRPLPRKTEAFCTSLLAHAVLFGGLHERIPATIICTHAAENIRDRRLSPVVESCELNAHNGEIVRRSLTKRVMPDRTKITVTSEIEVKYWIKHFGITREELERAVERKPTAIKISIV
jgi:hypothetical protein